jgi:alpha-tubulin suppressor-like RCC1 family protein
MLSRYIYIDSLVVLGKISAGYQHSIFVQNIGKTWAWGSNAYAQLGINSTVCKSTPVSILGRRKTFCEITGGCETTNCSLGIDFRGKVWAWGANTLGQLGINSIVNKSTPTSILGANKTFCVIMTSGLHTMAIDNHGQVWGWGYNTGGGLGPAGQLGDNTVVSKRTPVSTLGAKKTFCVITAGGSNSGGIDYNGQVWTWGVDNAGQLGRGTTNTPRSTPVTITGAKKTFCALNNKGAGSNYQAIDYKGRIWAWGRDFYGQLGINGNPAGDNTNTPVSVMGANKTFCKIANGSSEYTLAIDNHGMIWAWGYNASGQLGDAQTINRSTPVSVLGSKKTFCSVEAGDSHSLAIDYNERVWAWGYDNLGQLGDNIFVNNKTPTSIHGTNKTFCLISAKTHTLGIDNHGEVWGWGFNNKGQIGDNTTMWKYSPYSLIGSNKTFCQISAGFSFSLSIDKNGRVWGWGYNNKGQIGDNSVTSKSTPVSILGANKTFCFISGGESHAISIDYNGLMWGWGYNYYGQLGIGNNANGMAPFSVNGANKTFCEIAAGQSNSHGIQIGASTGRTYSWGYNNLGQLGIYSTIDKSTPVSILGANRTFCKILDGGSHTITVDRIGKVRSWGYNPYGEIGDNSITNRSTPISVLGGNKTFCNIGSGVNHSLGIDLRGKIWAWGYNANGQLGDNSVTSRRTPKTILGANKTFCAVDGGSAHSMGIDKNGRIWSWGYNNVGQLGNNSITSVRSPVSILGGNKTFCKITGGGSSTLAIDKNGRVWGWGYNNRGQLGNNAVVSRRTPVSILGGNKTFCQIVATTGTHSLAIDKNGQIWGWGRNDYGQIGDNSLISRSTPVSIHAGNITFCKISAGLNHSLSLDNHGQVWGWGYNDHFQLGRDLNTKTPIMITNI